MLTRRRFLGYSGAGMLAMASGCRPANLDALQDRQDPWSANQMLLADKASRIDRQKLVLGYPINMNTPPSAFFDWRQKLIDVGINTFAYNNVGNPFEKSPIPYNSHDFERETIKNFAELFAFPQKNTWGFLSHSGTDSNMHGMYMGRTILKGRTGVIPKAYFTVEAHYSVQILGDLLGLETVFVETQPDGSMDPIDLRQKLAANPNQPALIVATIGTTFKGAIDPIDHIREAVKGHASFLHLDAALFGGYLPYTTHADEILYQLPDQPNSARYDSIAVSCHKFFGFPSPAGLFITTADHFSEFNGLFGKIHNPEYIHHVPGTITCSRDAVKPAEFYFFSQPSASANLTEDAHAILQNASYLVEQMQSRLTNLQPIRASHLSNTVYFKKPSDKIIEKYSLATMQLSMNQQKHDYAHVVVMPHANREVLSEFLADLEHDTVTRAL